MAVLFADSKRIKKIMEILELYPEYTLGFTLEVMLDDIPRMTVTQYIEEKENESVE